MPSQFLRCRREGDGGVWLLVDRRVNDSQHAVQAALASHCVPIVSRLLVAYILASGLLIMLFDHVLPGETYHFACSPALGGRANVVALREWFRNKLAAY